MFRQGEFLEFRKSVALVIIVLFMVCFKSTVSAQTKPDDSSINIGLTLFTDYSYTESPKMTDNDGNLYNPSGFNITRSYLNVTGKISHLVSFRITPDVVRETGTGSSLNGSLMFRIKYAFVQLNTSKATWVRLGVQQTPYLDYSESIYRYRFQGTMFVEREGYFASADAGTSFHYDLPNNYGDIHVGYYNGENYNKEEVNDQKGLMVRATARPLPKQAVLKGLRASVFYDDDSYMKNAERKRFISQVTFEHARVNAGVEYLYAKDQISVSKPEVTGKGYSVWATPKLMYGFEALLRYDHIKPNTLFDTQERNRTIFGIAYWFPHICIISYKIPI